MADNKELVSKQFFAEAKVFFLDLKENQYGRFLQVRAGGVRRGRAGGGGSCAKHGRSGPRMLSPCTAAGACPPRAAPAPPHDYVPCALPDHVEEPGQASVRGCAGKVRRARHRTLIAASHSALPGLTRVCVPSPPPPASGIAKLRDLLSEMVEEAAVPRRGVKPAGAGPIAASSGGASSDGTPSNKLNVFNVSVGDFLCVCAAGEGAACPSGLVVHVALPR